MALIHLTVISIDINVFDMNRTLKSEINFLNISFRLIKGLYVLLKIIKSSYRLRIISKLSIH